MIQSEKTRILIAEDEPTQALKLQFILQQSGYEVSVAENGMHALDLIRQQPPALVISDIMMPVMHGYELCRAIRADESLKNMHVILLTSHSNPTDVLHGLESGADSFVTKPYNAKSLLARVHQILSTTAEGTSGNARPTVDITFDGEKYSINSSRQQILNFFVSTYESMIQKNAELAKARDELQSLSENLERKVGERTQWLQEEIKERQRVEEQIREQAALLDKAQDAIAVHDLEGNIVYWNESATRVYGWGADEIIGKNAEEILYKEVSTAAANSPLRRALENGEWSGELKQTTKDEKDITVQSRWTLVRDNNGEPKSLLVINSDITEKKRLEAQVLRTQRMESIGTLAGGIAHDLNNVLSPILLSVNLLERKLPDEQSKQILKLVESSARRGGALVKQVLTFARGFEGERTLMSLSHIIKELQTFATQSFPKTVELKTNWTKNLWNIHGDPTQIHQVLLNLCVNARDAMPHGGSVRISAENTTLDRNYAAMNPEAKPGLYVALKVKDTGTGIPPEVLERIFEPFFTTKEVGKGTGIGLSTLHAIVKGHGGFVTVQTEVGKGTEFSVYLPAVESTAGEFADSQEQAIPDGAGELVLVAEDEPVIREITKDSLERHGYKTVIATDGIEALSLYLQHKDEIKLVVLDMIMPYMDGPATIRALEKMNPNVKVLAVSGSTEKFKLAEAAARKPLRFLPKPYTTDKLLSVMDEVLHEAA
ncbi:MAG: response regulator [Bacteroidetes bacterium]|nr:response regulator [Bacteroidota bacterium]MCW5895672.1 response regulator [Bacteroidota bacterium]